MAVGRTEANAYGSAGYNNHFRSLYSYEPEYLEQGIAQLERALVGDGWVVAEDRAYYRLVEMLLQAGVDPRPVIEEALRQFPGHLPLRTIEALESLVVPGGGNVELGLVLPAYRY